MLDNIENLQETTQKTAQSVLMHIKNLAWISFIKIILILAFCVVLRILLKKIRKKALARIKKSEGKDRLSANACRFFYTLIPMGESIAKFLILAMGVLSILSILEISVKPFVYCFGLLSVGISFGAKDIFADMIRGILTLAEGKISLGHFVTINGRSLGHVEALSIRQITIRHLDGAVEAFPFSKVDTIQNFSMGYHVMSPAFCLAPDAPIEEFQAMVFATLDEMKEHAHWKKYILNKTEFHPDFEFTKIFNTGIEIRIHVKTKIDPNGLFESEFNRRMLELLQKTTMLRVVK
ncbi:hypothetical protein AGMMS49949_06920 [Alphaproteobacteria bacterium]|nr:hypothetical protein AGMMS49949_06920 [Alphaproteobacteria bacterium]GHS98614.1 hypothetical protein AGMMS50296_6380 [Alphaproteobacteria bacterium]